MEANPRPDPNLIIDRLGGTNAVARLCEIEPASVSEWRKTGIPNARLMFLRLAKPEAFEPPQGEAHSESRAS